MKKIIISAAVTGGQIPKEGDTRPITPEEIAADVVRCAKAGAAICHIHARDAEGKHTSSIDSWRLVDKAIRQALIETETDVILNYTTSAGSGEARMAHIRELHPEMCSCDSGTLNWTHDTMFINSPEFLVNLGECCKENRIKPEIEIFDANMVKWALRMRDRGHYTDPLHFQLMMGTYGGIDATVENLVFLRSKLPQGSTFSVSGIAAGSVPMIMAALAMGADGIRVGMEDNAYMSKGVHATNLMQVERAVRLTELAGYGVASPKEAREILHLI